MTGEVLTLAIEWSPDGAVARGEGRSVHAHSPADLWRGIAASADDRPVHLLAAGQAVVSTGQAEAADGLRRTAADAAIGRAGFAGGARSPRLTRKQGLHYIDVPAGALLCGPDALARAARLIDRPWDALWSHDLAFALYRQGPVTLCDAVLAEGSAPKPPIARLPFRRAGAGSVASEAPLILIYGRLTASVSLYFDGWPDDIASRLRFLEPGDLFSDLPWLSAASLVVVVRGFEHMQSTGAADLLAELGTPMVWFTDDDFLALAEESPSLGFYTPAALRAFAQRCAGLAVTSEGLARALSAYHANIRVLSCVLDPLLWARRPDTPASPPRAAAFGGPFRRRSFEREVLPAVRKAGMEMVAAADLASPGSGIMTRPFDSDFRSFVFGWQELAPTVMVHPYGDTRNIASKGPGSLLAAAYLGGVPVIGREPAYEGLGEAEGVLLAGPEAESWAVSLGRVRDETARATLAGRLARWAEATFAPEVARPGAEWLFALAAPGGVLVEEQRLARALLSGTLQRALPRQPRWRQSLGRLKLSLSRRLAGWRRR